MHLLASASFLISYPHNSQQCTYFSLSLSSTMMLNLNINSISSSRLFCPRLIFRLVSSPYLLLSFTDPLCASQRRHYDLSVLRALALRDAAPRGPSFLCQDAVPSFASPPSRVPPQPPNAGPRPSFYSKKAGVQPARYCYSRDTVACTIAGAVHNVSSFFLLLAYPVTLPVYLFRSSLILNSAL